MLKLLSFDTEIDGGAEISKLSLIF